MRELLRKWLGISDMSIVREEINTVDIQIKAVKILPIQTGDTLVLETPMFAPESMVKRLSSEVEAKYGAKLMLLQGGMTLATILKQEADNV